VIALLGRSIAARVRESRTLVALTVTGVALGVASVLSIQVVGLNAVAAFEGSVRAVGGDADLSVLAATGALEDDAIVVVLADPAVAAAWPMTRLDVALAGRTDAYVEIVGVDLFAPIDLPWEVAPAASADPLAVPGWVAISPELAAELDLRPGDTFRVSSGSRQVELHVGALVDFRRVTPLASRRLVVMDLAQAQDRFGLRDRVDQIDVRLRPGEAPSAAAERLTAALGPGARVVTPEQRRQEAAGLLAAFRLNLTALSLVSLFVGTFLVYTSVQAALVRRREELGVLRSVGTTRGQLVALVLGETALIALAGVALGIPLGYVVASLQIERVSATLSNLYLLRGIEALSFPVWLVPLAVAIGLGGALVGAIAPTIEMSRSSPRALLAAQGDDLPARFGTPLLLAAGALAIAVAWVSAAAAGPDWKPGGFVIGLGLLVALPLVTPWVVERATHGLGPTRLGLAYGVKALGLRLRTGAFAVAALAVAVSMLFGVTILVGSFRSTIDGWIRATLHADVYVTTDSWRRAREEATLAPEVLAALAAHPAVAEVDRLRQIVTYAGERRITLSGVDMQLSMGLDRFGLVSGDKELALERVRDHGAVLVGEPLARKAGIQPGDRLEVAGPRGPLAFEVAAIAYDYSSETGSAAMDLRTMERAFGPGAVSNAALFLVPGADVDRTIAELRTRFAGTPLRIRSNAELRDEVFKIFDQTFAITRLLQLMSLLVAACGVALTLLVLARERVFEIALYRALGATRGQVLEVFLGKGLGIALFGLGLGAVGGIGLAWILVHRINPAWFGWTMAMHAPWSEVLSAAAAIVGTAVLASVYPAVRASRTPATELSRENL